MTERAANSKQPQPGDHAGAATFPCVHAPSTNRHVSPGFSSFRTSGVTGCGKRAAVVHRRRYCDAGRHLVVQQATHFST